MPRSSQRALQRRLSRRIQLVMKVFQWFTMYT